MENLEIKNTLLGIESQKHNGQVKTAKYLY